MHDDLRNALRRVEPPAGYAERGMQNVRDDRNVRLKPDATNVRASSRWSWAVAATLVVALGGGVWYRAEEQRRGEEAKRQVLLSLNIAGSKLRAIEIKVNNHGEER